MSHFCIYFFHLCISYVKQSRKNSTATLPVRPEEHSCWTSGTWGRKHRSIAPFKHVHEIAWGWRYLPLEEPLVDGLHPWWLLPLQSQCLLEGGSCCLLTPEVQGCRCIKKFLKRVLEQGSVSGALPYQGDKSNGFLSHGRLPESQRF